MFKNNVKNKKRPRVPDEIKNYRKYKLGKFTCFSIP